MRCSIAAWRIDHSELWHLYWQDLTLALVVLAIAVAVGIYLSTGGEHGAVTLGRSWAGHDRLRRFIARMELTGLNSRQKMMEGVDVRPALA
jgi:hypothetical protein